MPDLTDSDEDPAYYNTVNNGNYFPCGLTLLSSHEVLQQQGSQHVGQRPPLLRVLDALHGEGRHAYPSLRLPRKADEGTKRKFPAQYFVSLRSLPGSWR